MIIRVTFVLIRKATFFYSRNSHRASEGCAQLVKLFFLDFALGVSGVLLLLVAIAVCIGNVLKKRFNVRAQVCERRFPLAHIHFLFCFCHLQQKKSKGRANNAANAAMNAATSVGGVNCASS